MHPRPDAAARNMHVKMRLEGLIITPLGLSPHHFDRRGHPAAAVIFVYTVSDGEIQNSRSKLRGSPETVPRGHQTMARVRDRQRHSDHSGQQPGRLFGPYHLVRRGRPENR
jgi:hypothetical protein